MMFRYTIIVLKEYIFYISYYLSIKKLKFPQFYTRRFLSLHDSNFIFNSVFLSESDFLLGGSESFMRPCSLFHVEV
jgi:hypothetical protein